jgi:hypothetical protein
MRPTLARTAQGGLASGTISTACSAERLRAAFGLLQTAGAVASSLGRITMGSRCQRCSSAVGCTGWSPAYRSRRPTKIDTHRRRRAMPASHREDDLCVLTPLARRIGIPGRRSGSGGAALGMRRLPVEDASGSDGKGQFTGSILLALRPLHRWRRPSRPAPGQLRSRQTGVRMTAAAERSREDIHSLVHRSYSHSYPQPLSRGSQDPEMAARRLFGGMVRGRRGRRTGRRAVTGLFPRRDGPPPEAIEEPNPRSVTGN